MNKEERKEIKKLKEEKRYNEIYFKYGEKEYNKLLAKAMYEEIKESRGTMKASMWRIKNSILKITKRVGLLSTVVLLEGTALMAGNTEKIIDDNRIKYEKEIEDYNKDISKYAKKVNSMNLSEIQIFMKVMDDMWENIKGYKTPQKDITGFLELDLATPEGYGVCRNMASDVAKKINAINPEYNARTCVVEMGNEGVYYAASIQRNIIEENQTVVEENQTETQSNGYLQKLIGNHMVTLVDVKEDNLTLVLDPTNPGIGIYSDGQIIMFNSAKENGLEFDAKEYVNAVFFQGGIDGIGSTYKDYIKSYKKPKLSLEEIYRKYGIEAQNRALEEVKNIENMKNEIDEARNFRETMQVTSKEDKMEENMSFEQEKIQNLEKQER